MNKPPDHHYLLKALRSFRVTTYGQFDAATEHVVRETQDAANAIEDLEKRLKESEDAHRETLKQLREAIDRVNDTIGRTDEQLQAAAREVVRVCYGDKLNGWVGYVNLKPRNLLTAMSQLYLQVSKRARGE